MEALEVEVEVVEVEGAAEVEVVAGATTAAAAAEEEGEEAAAAAGEEEAGRKQNTATKMNRDIN